MPLKEKFNVIHGSSRHRRHDSTLRATGGTPGFNQEAEAGASSGCGSEPFLSFLWLGQGKQIRNVWFE